MFSLCGRARRHGVQRLTVGRRVLGVHPMAVHAYRVGATLIDAGSPRGVGAMAPWVEGVEHVLLTHHHEDHVGAAALLAGRGATVWAPEPAQPYLADPPPLRWYQRRVWGRPEPVEARTAGEVVETPDGRFEVVAVPGHSPDHVAYFDRDRDLLFTGDAYLGPRPILRADEDLPALVESLGRLRALEPGVLLPGHGSTSADPARGLQATLDHYRDLAERAHALHRAGHGPRAVRRALLGREGFIRLYTGGHFAKQNLVDQLLAMEPPEVGRGPDPAPSPSP